MYRVQLNFIVIIVLSFLIACSRKTAPVGATPNNTIKVLTYNAHHCNPPAKPGTTDADAIAAVIKNQGADIVALQKIDINTGRSGKINEVDQLAKKSGYKFFFFAKAIDFDGGEYGITILSKYELSDTKAYALPLDESIGGERRMLAVGTVTLSSGKSFRFGCTHLDAERRDANRILQIKEISRIASEISLPFIVAGDFNSAEGSDVINILDENFTRTCHNCGPAFQEENESVQSILLLSNLRTISPCYRIMQYPKKMLPITCRLLRYYS